MMNYRTLQLLREPEDFTQNDLPILEAEIRKYPYVQSIHALYLYGVHQFLQNSYREELSRTAAYTTDKKILYQFINRKRTGDQFIPEEAPATVPKVPTISKFDVSKVVQTEMAKPADEVFVNGELNRILFKGEEDFLDRSADAEDFSKTTIIEENRLENAHKSVEDESNISFESIENIETESEVDVAENKIEFQESADAEDFSKTTIIEENRLENAHKSVEDESNISFESVENIETESEEDVAENKIEFQESADAEDFSKTTIIEENRLENAHKSVEDESNISFESIENIETESEEDVAENKIEFQESADAEDFSKTKVIEENQLENAHKSFEDESNISFESVENIETESEVDVAENKIEFQESADAEDFSKTTIIEENRLENAHKSVEDESNISFESIENIETESEVDVAENKIEFQESADAESFSKESIVEEGRSFEGRGVREDATMLSFHGTEDFMPNTQLKAKVNSEFYEVPKPKMSRHEEEMQRLIAQVEAKMKTRKSVSESKNEMEVVPQNSGVDFSDRNDQIEPLETKNKLEFSDAPTEKAENLVLEPDRTPWKPMTFSGNTPDSILGSRSAETQNISQVQERPQVTVEDSQKGDEERPVINMSFMGVSEVLAPKVEKDRISEKEVEKNHDNSNVPQFINTWQNWLKIDRTVSEDTSVSQPVIQSKAIEKFIETEPKISPLKEENSFVVREKSGDIWHLMTETLASLYVEQKLYTKALKAYDILIEKYPEKTEYFEKSISKIKEMRGGNFK